MSSISHLFFPQLRIIVKGPKLKIKIKGNLRTYVCGGHQNTMDITQCMWYPEW